MKTLLTLALLLSAATPAIAQEAPGGVRIATADINLSTTEGVAQLDRRIARAIDRVCPETRGRELNSFHTLHACRTAVMRSVAAQRQHLLESRTGTLSVASTR